MLRAVRPAGAASNLLSPKEVACCSRLPFYSYSNAWEKGSFF